MSKHYFFIILRGLFIIGLIIAGYFLFKFTFMYIYPFVIASLLAYMIIPVVNQLELTLKIPRTMATLMVMFFMILFITGSMTLITTEVFQGTLYLADKMPTYFQNFISIIDKFVNTKLIPIYQKIASLFYSLNPSHQATITDYIQDLNKYITAKGASLVQSLFIQIPVFLTLLPSSITVIFFVVLATFFITNDWQQIQKQVLKLFPSLHQASYHFLNHFKSVIINYVKAQLILIFITGCLIYSGLLILKIEHALTISLFIAIVDLLPLIGTGFVFIPWILYLFLTGNYPLTIGLIIIYMLVIIVRQLLEPKILTASIGINPLVGLIILFISIQVFGGMGFILTPFILILFAVLKKSRLLTKILFFIKGEPH